ncbi:MAG: hypothetical protein UY55_C0009G0003, partial [Candidatus Jorgensenbacteria bacterium GW2011_GWB1_50_10]
MTGSSKFKKILVLGIFPVLIFAGAFLFFGNEAQADVFLWGAPLIGSAVSGGDVTLIFNIEMPPRTGDVVILFGGHGCDGVCTAIGPITSGYTLATSTNGADVQVGVWYKVMEATPDLTVQGEGGGDGGDAVAYGA